MKNKRSYCTFVTLIFSVFTGHTKSSEDIEKKIKKTMKKLYALQQQRELAVAAEEHEKSKKYQYVSYNAVIPRYSGGRFGDNLMACAHALYFALRNQCRFLLVPFPYSDHLELDTLEKYTQKDKFLRKSIVHGDLTMAQQDQSTLFEVPYFPESWAEYKMEHAWYPFPIDWDDDHFKGELRRLMAPKRPLNLVKPKSGMISVAVHVRTGGGYDTFDNVTSFHAGLITYKIPYEDYYIQQIQKLSALLNHAPLYVYLFTDDQHPQALAERYAQRVGISSIEFDCRKSKNRHDMNVLEDFFSMMNFDVLIRSDSSYSIMAEKLGNHKLVLFPGELQKGLKIQEGLVRLKYSWHDISTKAIHATTS